MFTYRNIYNWWWWFSDLKTTFSVLKKKKKMKILINFNLYFLQVHFQRRIVLFRSFFHFPHFWKSPALWHRQFVPHKLHLHEELKQQSPGLWSQLLPRRMQLLLFKIKKVSNKKMIKNILCKYECFCVNKVISICIHI